MERERSFGHLSEPLALRRILAILRRRWLIVVVAAIITPAVVVAGSWTQTPVYESSSDVLLSFQNLAGSLTGTLDSTVTQDPARIAQTQAQLARVPEVAKRTLAAAGQPNRDVNDFLDSSSVTTSSTSDLLTFHVKDKNRALAQTLATEYARQFIAYRLQLDTAAIDRARTELQSRIRQLRRDGAGNGGLVGTLIEKDQTLQTLQSLQTSNALLVREGGTAGKVYPTPLRNGLLGLGLGLLVGIGFAFLREALDTTVRNADEISERLGLTLLARLPEPPRRLRSTGRLAMLEEPTGVDAEAYRMLRTNLEFVDLDRRARVIAVTSAVNDEGKSTTAANLAVAFARAGSRVILVDLDLRRPTLHTFFGLADRPGVTDAILRDFPVDDALETVHLETPEQVGPTSGGLRNGAGESRAGLEVLPSGPPPADASQLVSSPALGALLADLRHRCDLMIVDTPPLLRVGDTMTMSVNVDALVVVARVNAVSRQMLSESARLLRRMRATPLGVVVTGAHAGDDYAGGYYGYGASPQAEDLARRTGQ